MRAPGRVYQHHSIQQYLRWKLDMMQELTGFQRAPQ